ncbi:hypothetical protein GALMADRAFT_367523 [Galerina marginata CBS 339.88]|uniref:Uncharacterized protein n=1 Tax=Galerina marginata (strain CBS 339.88) TaxID=685588 RepID=A0A067TQQ8_GALM3|nr:hypothetical protein GALMADRAFT_367523 [Galerina marginata CBS 339.88]
MDASCTRLNFMSARRVTGARDFSHSPKLRSSQSRHVNVLLSLLAHTFPFLFLSILNHLDFPLFYCIAGSGQ